MRYWDRPKPVDIPTQTRRLREIIKLLTARYPPIRFTPRL